jgi:uncharacterized protein (TIGR03435 family)
LLVAAGWASVAVGQTQSPAVRPEFEVVSVKPAPPPVNGVSSRESVDGALLTYTNFTLQRLISNAYGVTEGQIVGPALITDNLFDIHARLPAGVSRSDVPAMLQGMLAARFQLVVERVKKKTPVYVLVIAKGGHKMKPAVNDDSGYGGGIRRIDGRGATMATLAKLLSSRELASRLRVARMSVLSAYEQLLAEVNADAERRRAATHCEVDDLTRQKDSIASHLAQVRQLLPGMNAVQVAQTKLP